MSRDKTQAVLRIATTRDGRIAIRVGGGIATRIGPDGCHEMYAEVDSISLEIERGLPVELGSVPEIQRRLHGDLALSMAGPRGWSHDSHPAVERP
jgi:hypothetical protein